MEKVIFLDIDGVLCTLRSHFAFGDHGGLMQAWDITCCQMIRRICAEYKCKIVISSTWRHQKELNRYLCVYGLVDHIWSDSFKFDGDWKTPWMNCDTRGEEIDAWLKKHPEVTQYIIIDDDSDFIEYQKPFHIKTDTDEGFSSQNYMDCEQLLKKFSALDGC